MALVPKIDPNKIFASNAPTQDKPAAFDNYEKGMDETRKNLGRPTIKQSNYLHQTADQKILWIHQNGGGLPYDPLIEYAENAVTLKDGELKQLVDGAWVETKTKSLPATAITTSSGQNQQQINDFGGAKWYAKVGGYELGATVKLENGDIVKSTFDGNAVNPNVNIENWRFTEIAASILATPESVNADPTGVQDVTTALNMLANPVGRSIMFLTKGDFKTGTVVIPPNTICYMNGAKLIRKQYTGSPVIDVGEDSIIVSAIVDGNKDTLGVGGAIADSGIRLRSGAVALFCSSKNNRSHGITARGTDLSTTTSNQKALFCKASNNGFNAGASGSADGFNAANSNNFLFFGCESYNNARTGFVAETYNTNIVGDDKHDISFSVGGKFKSCSSWGNGYGDYNAEMVSNPIFDDVSGESISFRGSPRTNITNSNVGQIYGLGADFARVNNVNIVNSTRSSDLLFVTGKSPKVSNVDITLGESMSLSGTAITIQDSTGFTGEVSDISVNRAQTGMLLRVANARGLRVDSATNLKFIIGRSGGTASVNSVKQISDRKLEIYSSAIPTAGYFAVGDIVWNILFGATNRTICWVCTTAGTSGTWEPVDSVGMNTTTSTNLSSATNSINTTNKRVGVQIINTTDNKIYYTRGVAAVSAWYSADGVNIINPV